MIFCGVYYHLKDPLLAFAKLRQVLKSGGIMIVEGAVIDDLRDCYATFYYHQLFDTDASNWWVPTIRCLQEWIECSFFSLRTLHPLSRGNQRLEGSIKESMERLLRRRPSFTRIALTAEAIKRRDSKYRYPDEHLRPFDVHDR